MLLFSQNLPSHKKVWAHAAPQTLWVSVYPIGLTPERQEFIGFQGLSGIHQSPREERSVLTLLVTWDWAGV